MAIEAQTRELMLGVNIDHVATVRQARGVDYPDPVRAALLAEDAGADAITCHLREDRRHIQERDVRTLLDTIRVPMNLELAATPEMIAFAVEMRPAVVLLVPEKREELTTEGGLDVAGQRDVISGACETLGAVGIEVSLFIDPDERQIEASHACGADAVELHTGAYAEAVANERTQELARLIDASRIASDADLRVNAGHGLYYDTVKPVAAIPELVELNIGHGIVARAVMTGFFEAVATMKRLMREARFSS